MTIPAVEDIKDEIRQRFEVVRGSIQVLAVSAYNVVIEFRLLAGPHLVLRVDLTHPPSTDLEVAILKHLQDKSFPAPRLLPGHENPVHWAGHPGVLRHHCPGASVIKTNRSRGDYAAFLSLAARCLSALHLETLDFRFPTARRDIFSEIDRALRFRSEIARLVVGGEHLVQEAVAATAAVKKVLQEGPAAALVHNDYRPQNVLFETSTEVSAVIDYEWSIPEGPAIKDVAHAALEWSTLDEETDIDWGLLWLFVDTYQAALPQSHPLDVDRAELLVWMRFGALADACTYAAQLASEGRRGGRSHMYRKAMSVAGAIP